METSNSSLRKYNVPCDLNLQKGFWLKTLNFLGMCHRQIQKQNLYKNSWPNCIIFMHKLILLHYWKFKLWFTISLLSDPNFKEFQ